MNNLKKGVTGRYKARDVDELLQKVRNDYEKCLKEQKDRIISLREENRGMASLLEMYRNNEKHIIDAIMRADETAKQIVEEAESTAKEILDRAKSEEMQLRNAAEGCYYRLCKLKRASEAIYRAVAKVMGEHEDAERVILHTSIRPVKNLAATTGD